MKNNMRMMRLGYSAPRFFTLLALVTQIFLTSCNEDPSFLGRNLLPATDDLTTTYVDTTQIHSFPEAGLPIFTASNNTLLLGSLHDPWFGFSKADLMARFDVTPKTIAAGFRIDSMVLELSISGHYGDSSLQNVRIYALSDTIHADSAYLSNTLPDGKYDPAELASGQVSPIDTLARFRILNEDFIDRFAAIHDSIFIDQSDFYDVFLGFYITSDAVAEKGAIIYLDVLSSKTQFIMYYQDDDTTGTKQLNMSMNQFVPRINSFYHEYTGSHVEPFLSDTSIQDTLAYISAMGGVNTKLSFPGIESWLDKKPIAINKAELIIPAEDTLISGYDKAKFPAKLLLYTYDDSNSYDYTYDYRIDNSSTKAFYDGNYDPAKNAYVFNMGVHLQAYLQGDIENLNLILLASHNMISANRVILKGPGAKDRKMQLKIIYTEF